jgi:hypothetical protein
MRMASKFKTGELVRFLNDVGGGVVNRIDQNGNIYVLTEDGFEIPVSEKELITAKNFTHSDINELSEPLPAPVITKKPDKTERIKQKEQFISPDLYKQIPVDAPVNILLGFVTDKPGPAFSGRLAGYLINDSMCYAYYAIGVKEKGALRCISSGIIEPETKCLIGTFDQTAISKISDFHIQAIWVSGGTYRHREPVDILINISTINFGKDSYYRENDYFEENALLINITGKIFAELKNSMVVTEEVKQLKKNADKTEAEKVQKKETESDTLEVDLHMEALDTNPNLSKPGDIITFQMNKFHSAMEEALSRKLRRLILIHGLGQGTLKMQIRKELQEKYPQYVFQDASFKEYGFGATMVHLTYKL